MKLSSTLLLAAFCFPAFAEPASTVSRAVVAGDVAVMAPSGAVRAVSSLFVQPESGRVGVGTRKPNAELDVSGSIFYSGIMEHTSDKRLKHEISDLPESLPSLLALRPKTFVMNSGGHHEMGFIAQDVEGVYPVLVSRASDASGTLSLNYVGLIAPLVKSVQELAAENRALRGELERVRGRVDALSPSR